MARTFTGYLVAVTNPGFSGIATAHFVRTKKALKAKRFTPETVRRVPVEAGFGVRQLVGAFRDAGHYPIDPSTAPRVRFSLDGGLLHSFELEG